MLFRQGIDDIPHRFYRVTQRNHLTANPGKHANKIGLCTENNMMVLDIAGIHPEGFSFGEGVVADDKREL